MYQAAKSDWHSREGIAKLNAKRVITKSVLSINICFLQKL